MDWIADPQVWIAFLTLAALEIVLGIDNIVFISILVGKLPPDRRAGAYRIGRRTDDPRRGLVDTITLLDGRQDPHVDLVHLDPRESGEPASRPAGTAVVAVASGLVQVRVAGQTPALRHGEVLVADSAQIKGWRNLSPSEAVVFWIVFSGQAL